MLVGWLEKVNQTHSPKQWVFMLMNPMGSNPWKKITLNKQKDLLKATMFMIALVQVPKDSGHQNSLPNLFPLPFTTPSLLGPTAVVSNAPNRRIGSPRHLTNGREGSHRPMKTGSLLVAKHATSNVLEVLIFSGTVDGSEIRNPARKTSWYGPKSPIFTTGFIHPTGGWPWDFWTINSMSVIIPSPFGCQGKR